jgi:microcystin-dependent protein
VLAGQVVEIVYTGTEWRLAMMPVSRNRLLGEVVKYIGATPPDGFVWAAGQNLLRAQYTELHAMAAAMSYPWGSGDGSTTFGVPDLRGRVVVGKDNMGGTAAGRVTSGNSGIAGATLGAVGGDERSQLHNHTATDAGHTHTGSVTDSAGHNHVYWAPFGGSGFPGWASWSIGGRGTSLTSDGNGAHSHTFTTALGTANISVANALAGGSQNMPPAMILNCILFAGA